MQHTFETEILAYFFESQMLSRVFFKLFEAGVEERQRKFGFISMRLSPYRGVTGERCCQPRPSLLQLQGR
jgi:hypothetical protein